MKCIVIEDEPPALKKLVSFIEKIGYLEIAGTFDNAVEAISFLKRNSVDLIFLDIHMEEFTGIQFLETVYERPRVIVTTAYDQYALKGYELDVTDYLLKPFTFERFVQAVEKVFKLLDRHSWRNNSGVVFVKTEHRLEKIDVADILYIEAKSEYLQIVSARKKIMTLHSFRSIEELLASPMFVRVHRSYVVAIDKIDNIERNRITIQDIQIPVSDTYKEVLLSRIAVLSKK